MTYSKTAMGIQRYGTTQRWSDAVVFNRVAYLCEVPSNLDGDIHAQTQEVLGLLKSRLEEVGSSGECILNATIYIPDPADLPGFNALWDAWVPQGTAPVRACIHAALTNPKMRVEVTLQAAIIELP
ncbi:MAG: RidA family protein [Limnobacter sp.]|nr:RidA family protein [Limnobacter sp.]